MSHTLLDAVAERAVVADGAMGTRLYSLGVSFDRNFDELCLTWPDLVRGVHMDYIAAGAELVETNTFGANRFRLAEHGLSGEVEAINRAAVRLAREAAERAAANVWVGGSMGPLGVTLAPVGAISRARAREAFAAQAAALADEGVDVLMVETMSTRAEALVAMEAVRAVCDLPVIVSMTFGHDGLTADGAMPEEAAEALTAAGADIVGANCSTGPAPLLGVVARMASATDRPVSAMPNAGLPTLAGGRYIYTSSPSYMAGVVRDMVDEGVRLVGGCCGTTPDHIAAIRAALAEGDGRAHGVTFPLAERVRVSSGAGFTEETPLQRALEERFVVTVEVDPPNGFSLEELLPRLRTLRDTGCVDAFDVADSPRAQARMSALALAALLQGELGVDTVLHMACRHRNLVAVHSELLGAHALGVRNIFVVMGDLPAIGDYPDATAVRDITATGLMRLLSSFNRGVDANERPLDDETSFHIGCAFNFNAPDIEAEMRLLEKKVDSGAQFAMTQPVYDPERVRATLRRSGSAFPLPLILGVLPLWNDRHAAFLHHEVPGIDVPAAVLERMETTSEPRVEGVAVARETLLALEGVVQGAYFMPPFGHYELVPEVLDGLSIRAPAAAVAP